MINNFSSFFEIFAGLNLAYAGSEGFRNAVDDEILTLKNAITPEVENDKKELDGKIAVTLIGTEFEEKIKEKADKIKVDFEDKSDSLITSEVNKRKFTEGFKSMFLITALYCIIVLIIGGFQGSEGLKDSKTPVLYLMFLLLILFFNVFVFLRSFTKFYHTNIKPTITTIFLFLIIFFSFLTCLYCPVSNNIKNYLTETECLTYSLIIPASPYIFHFIRVYLHKQYFRINFLLLGFKTNRKLKEIEKWMDFLHN